MTRPHNDRVTRIGSKEELEPITFWDYVFVLGATAVITLVVLGVLDMIVGWIY